ncbi:MAG: hypothetical protein WBO17_07745 [Sphingorhabdus sp.]
MKEFFRRLLGNDQPQSAGAPARTQPFEFHEYSHGLVRIAALDFFGHRTTSPNGDYHLIWMDRDPDGSTGGYRHEGHGIWKLLSAADVLAEGRLERPQDGKVADNGTFVLNDSMFGDGLRGRFTAFRADGQKLVEKEFSANLISNGLSACSPSAPMAQI